MKKFAVHPPCPRPPLALGQEVDPSSIRRGEEFPKEWAKCQAKLAKMTKEIVKKFNEDSAAATAEASSSKRKKAMPKKHAHKPSSVAMPSRPSSSNPSRHIPQAVPLPSVAKPSAAAEASASKPKKAMPKNQLWIHLP